MKPTRVHVTAHATVMTWGPDGDLQAGPVVVPVTLLFDPAHPAEVKLVVVEEPWVFDRSLLEAGTRAGEAAVAVYPRPDGVVIVLTTNEGRARIALDPPVVDRFVKLMQACVPADEVAYDVDAWLASIADGEAS